MNEEREGRRAKRFVLPNWLVLDFVRTLNKDPLDMIQIPLLTGDVPADAQIVSFHTDFARNALVVVIESEKFDFVEAGAEYPIVECYYTFAMRKVPAEDAGYEELPKQNR